MASTDTKDLLSPYTLVFIIVDSLNSCEAYPTGNRQKLHC